MKVKEESEKVGLKLNIHSTVYPGTTFSEVLPQIFTNKDLLVGKTSRKYLLLCLNFQEMSLILYFK